jgi:hypothetical protein
MKKKLKSIITKSIRLTPEEAQQIDAAVSALPGTESSILKSWVIEGAERTRLEQAVRAYSERLVDIRQGAEQAGLPYLEFIRELERRRITVLEDPQGFMEGFSALAERFGSRQMKKLARQGRQRGTLIP